MQKKERPESNTGADWAAVYPQELLDMSNEQLLDEADALMMLDDPDESDTQRMEQCLALLQERAPVMETYDTEKEWEELTEKHSLLFQVDAQEEKRKVKHISEKAARKRHLPLRILRYAEIAAGLLLVMVITANALGYNPIQVFLTWADGVVQMYSNPSGIMELPEDSPSEYRSLAEALTANGLDASGCPTWIPKDYEILMVNAVRTETFDKYSAIYYSERGEILVRVMNFKQEEWAVTDEREDGGHTEDINDTEYYIVTNLDQSKAGWSVGLYSYIISGQITEGELYRMINSIK